MVVGELADSLLLLTVVLDIGVDDSWFDELARCAALLRAATAFDGRAKLPFNNPFVRSPPEIKELGKPAVFCEFIKLFAWLFTLFALFKRKLDAQYPFAVFKDCGEFGISDESWLQFPFDCSFNIVIGED